MVKKFLVIVFCLFGFGFSINAQSNYKKKQFVVINDTIYLDTLSLIPGTIHLFKIDTLACQINYKLKALVFKKITNDTFTVVYKTFPYNFEKPIYHKSTLMLLQDLSIPQSPINIAFGNPDRVSDDFFSDGLNKNGSISRGISFGNNQDVVVNSNLNLQVSGKLTNEVELLLAATDDNIPFQADGTTAQLQEFDKVFVQLSTKSTKLIVGDFQLQKPTSYFMNFYKRAQGAYFSNAFNDTINNKIVTFKTQLSGAVSKGKFSRNIIQGAENNQGPYRLRGDENEPFIIVLSGTERVYIDGKLLERGQENDYIIDYNTAELTFTAKQIITKDKRIIAEFQYAERNYARSLYFFSEEVDAAKLKMRFNFFGEQDNKNKTLQQTLTEEQKLTLFNVGDTISKAFSSGAELATFNTTDVFYWKKDTVVNSFIYKSIFEYSTNTDSAKYRVKFSYVGENKGYYKQVSTTANGKVYKWFAPIAGILQGNYEPLVPLISPKKKQLFTTGANYEFNKNHQLDIEGAFSKNDINTFSSFDGKDDDGYGLKIQSLNKATLKKDTLLKQHTEVIYNLNYEYVQHYFSPLERYRSIEFERDWNRQNAGIINTDQHIGSLQTGIKKGVKLNAIYGLSFFDEGSFYKGLKHQFNGNYNLKNTNLAFNNSYLTSNNKIVSTGFYRHKTQLSQAFWKLRLNVNDEFEQNKFKPIVTNQLAQNSYQFWDWETSITNKDTTGNLFKLFYRQRQDKQAYNTVLKDSTLAKNTGFMVNINSVYNHPFSVLFTYRELTLNRAFMTIKPDNTLLSRVEYAPRFVNGFITSSLFYETGYGLENKKEYYYLEVPAGQGSYAWKDYNDNGLKELNEFEVSQFADQALFIRVYTPTNQYVKVLHDQFSFSFNLRPSVFVKDSVAKLVKFIGRFATQSVYRVDKKSNDNGKLFTFNPIDIRLNDSLLTALNYSFRQSLFFNQTAPIFGIDYSFQNNLNKQLLTNGFTTRRTSTHDVKWRLNLGQAWSINSANTVGKKSDSSSVFSTRNYSLEFYDLEEKLNFQPNTSFRVSVIYKYTKKHNQLFDGLSELAEHNDFGFELKYNQADKGSVNAKINLISISYNALQNTAIAYEMLNGLKIGYNYTWGISYQRNLTNNLQISINYDGRKSPNTKNVNIGGAQIRAYF